MGIDQAHNLDGNQRRQRDQCHDAEGVGDNISADGGAGADGQRQQKGGGHRAAGNAARVKGDADKDRRHKVAEDQRDDIAGNDDPVDV